MYVPLFCLYFGFHQLALFYILDQYQPNLLFYLWSKSQFEVHKRRIFQSQLHFLLQFNENEREFIYRTCNNRLPLSEYFKNFVFLRTHAYQFKYPLANQ